jgi:hypothetical protein
MNSLSEKALVSAGRIEVLVGVGQLEDGVIVCVHDVGFLVGCLRSLFVNL